MRLILVFILALNLASGYGKIINKLKNESVNPNESFPKFINEVGEQPIKFYVYSRENKEIPEIVESNVESIIRNVYNPLKPTVFSIHGWLSHKDSDENKIIVSTKLEQEDCNVIVVDYSSALGPIAVDDRAPYIGSIIADFIMVLHTYFDVKLSQIHLVGFSMGAQAAGFAGQYIYKFTGDKVSKITALDPAGGTFNTASEDERLSPDDAHFVEVVHTNGGVFAYYAPCGHADYYPNGGKVQPGCGVLNTVCSHQRSYRLVAEMWSIKNEYVVTKCASTDEMSLKECSWVNVNMGKNYERTGIYYLETNNAAPYGKGSFVSTFF
ncbi:phospholipase A1-like [Teleopsis dalmanni]|uniref:phospholipase A1-like n=1 Tax=Teleopsis dalmanni TaxID=139649 RepID=UPI0018CE15C2|nr:phospholipase A1-like [Teleopsis dalmanni]XP_037955379.1 phospholipase A1-like [Teleopsis dalmanni]